MSSSARKHLALNGLVLFCTLFNCCTVFTSKSVATSNWSWFALKIRLEACWLDQTGIKPNDSSCPVVEGNSSCVLCVLQSDYTNCLELVELNMETTTTRNVPAIGALNCQSPRGWNDQSTPIPRKFNQFSPPLGPVHEVWHQMQPKALRNSKPRVTMTACCLWHPNLWPNAPTSRHNQGIESGMNMEMRRKFTVQQSQKVATAGVLCNLECSCNLWNSTPAHRHTHAHLLLSVLASGACRCDAQGSSGASIVCMALLHCHVPRSGIDPMKCPSLHHKHTSLSEQFLHHITSHFEKFRTYGAKKHGHQRGRWPSDLLTVVPTLGCISLSTVVSNWKPSCQQCGCILKSP